MYCRVIHSLVLDVDHVFALFLLYGIFYGVVGASVVDNNDN